MHNRADGTRKITYTRCVPHVAERGAKSDVHLTQVPVDYREARWLRYTLPVTSTFQHECTLQCLVIGHVARDLKVMYLYTEKKD